MLTIDAGAGNDGESCRAKLQRERKREREREREMDPIRFDPVYPAVDPAVDPAVIDEMEC